MHLDRLLLTFGRAMRERHGVRVHKLPVDAGFTCPNRDGSKGIGGCTFCNNRSFAPARRGTDVQAQLCARRDQLRRRHPHDRYLAYFQAYTNTYADTAALAAMYRAALAVDGVVGLSVGTRPDCVPDAVLDLLARLRDEGHEVWLELGLQSAFDHTLVRINRGHGLAEYADAAQRARARGLPLCTHLILGLPGEEEAHWQESLARVLALGTDGLKLHPLHVVRNTRLAHDWRAGRYVPLERARYVEAAAQLVQRCPPGIVFHRLTATAPADMLLAPAWCLDKWPVLNDIALRITALRAGTPREAA